MLVHESAAIQVRVALKSLGQRGLATFVTVLTIESATLVPLQVSVTKGARKSHG
jgi:hypothetical protein